MKLVQNTVPTPFHAPHRPLFRWARPKLVPRRTLPTLSTVRVGGGPLDKLAWIFGWR